MPELPEVETVRRGLLPAVQERRITQVHLSGQRLRFAWPDGFVQQITGRRVEDVGRRGKYLLWRLSGGLWMLSHLGMSGRFSVLPAKAGGGEAGMAGDGAGKASGQALGAFYFHDTVEDGAGPHDHLLLMLDDGTRLVYTDPRRFGFFDLTENPATHPMLRAMGPEPLSEAFNAAHLARALHGRAAPVKNLLLDQKVVAGLGNIYVCEALFRARVSPRRKGASLAPSGQPTARVERLVAAVKQVLKEAIAAGGSTLRDHQRVDGASGGFQQRFDVYDREGQPCPTCGQPVRRIVQSGRSSFFCGRCQR